jgi:hypothetical protein
VALQPDIVGTFLPLICKALKQPLLRLLFFRVFVDANPRLYVGDPTLSSIMKISVTPKQFQNDTEGHVYQVDHHSYLL